MDYQVWTKNEYEGWSKVDCGDIEAAKREVLKAVMAGHEPLVTQSMSFNIDVTVTEVSPEDSLKERFKRGVAKKSVKEETEVEVTESRPEEDTVAGSEGDGSV